MEETVKDVGEFGLIDRIAKDLIYRPELVVIGSGDDGAVYRVPAGYDQVISTDTMVEGIHFIKKRMRSDSSFRRRSRSSCRYPGWNHSMRGSASAAHPIA